ncbi:unnamed protein product [Phyllotreta striolata]|uniref:DUF4781 domain-containing protein n=1 Tax=Phyllotreta striolata TaxID=444603 RepID=A0A9N9TVR4_PHYSR|nr:unnamed protein product [Phyllotreta striolata]
MEGEKFITIIIKSHFERIIELYEFDTVELLQIAIHRIFDIEPKKQLIKGWKNIPESDDTTLNFCLDRNKVNYLILSKTTTEDECTMTISKNLESLELEAVRSCYTQTRHFISTPHLNFNLVTFQKAISEVFTVPPDQRKAICLYLHNSNSPFPERFFKMIQHESLSLMIMNKFYMIGWDVQSEKHHSALGIALTEADLIHLRSFIETKMCAAFIIQYIEGTVKVQVTLADGITNEELYKHVRNNHDFLIARRLQLTCTETDQCETRTLEVDSNGFQSLMGERLGDRDYTSYSFDEHELMKKNIGFALFGPPEETTSYNSKQKKKIQQIYEAIVKYHFSEHNGQIELSVIFNCTEPLPDDKASRKKKNPKYNPDADIIPVPVFVIRKCRAGRNPCRILIDDVGRKYESWTSYINNNKLDECVMVLPKDGKYAFIGDRVQLERHPSPSCGIGSKILKVGDVASIVGSLGSGGVMLAGAAAGITTIAVAPVALIGAGIVGAGAGVYGLGRGIGNLVDRVKHDQSLSFADSEARGIYFNLLAGSMGFVGAGVNVAVSQLAARGIEIGKGVGIAVNTLGVANIGVSGASVINSTYDVFDQWLNEHQAPSMLTIVQLSASLLFFGNSVYNFQTCQVIVDEAQGKVLQDYSQSLRSNRHRKTFNKMMKETVRRCEGNQMRGQAEVIKTIRNIPNKDEVFAVLTRTNKLMNEKGVKFFAGDGTIQLNGYIINMNDFMILNKQEASTFLSNLPLNENVTVNDTNAFINKYSLTNWTNSPNWMYFAAYALRLIGRYESDVQGMLMQIARDVSNAVQKYVDSYLNEIIDRNLWTSKVLKWVMEYYSGKSVEFLKTFKKWLATGDCNYFKENYVDLSGIVTERNVKIISMLIRLSFKEGKLNSHEFLEITDYVMKLTLKKICKYRKDEERSKEINQNDTKQCTKVQCKICDGYYFQY